MIFVVCSCRVEYHPYDMRIDGERNINKKNISRIESCCRGADMVRFAVISDTQRWYDQTEKAVEAINSRDDIDFVIHAGDVADFGLRIEFERQRDILNRLKVPYVVVIGNHDCLATGDYIFSRIFGSQNFCFVASDVQFICLNTNSLEFERPASVPDLDYILQQSDNFPKECKRSIAIMHAAPDSEQFDCGLARVFHNTITLLPNLQCCIHGHGHQYRVEYLFDDIPYIMCDNIEKQSFLLFSITKDCCTHERVFF